MGVITRGEGISAEGVIRGDHEAAVMVRVALNNTRGLSRDVPNGIGLWPVLGVRLGVGLRFRIGCCNWVSLPPPLPTCLCAPCPPHAAFVRDRVRDRARDTLRGTLKLIFGLG